MSKYITNVAIEGFENLTKKQLWQTAHDHVNSTGKKSTEARLCLYGGIGCAASVFIKSEYRANLDALGVGGWNQLVINKLVPEHNRELIMAIQKCHDKCADDEEFLRDFNTCMNDIKPEDDEK